MCEPTCLCHLEQKVTCRICSEEYVRINRSRLCLTCKDKLSKEKKAIRNKRYYEARKK